MECVFNGRADAVDLHAMSSNTTEGLACHLQRNDRVSSTILKSGVL